MRSRKNSKSWQFLTLKFVKMVPRHSISPLMVLLFLAPADSFTTFIPKSALIRPTKVSSGALFSTTEKRPASPLEEKSDAVPRAPAKNRIQVGKAIPYSELTIGVLKEDYPQENRVSQSPDSVAGLVKAGFQVVVQSGGK